MQITKLEQALLCAAKAFAACYLGTEISYPGEPMPQPKPKPQSGPTPTSNGKPVCTIHGKEMRFGKYGYHCTVKIGPGDRDYCKEKARANG
jgi:hypothetical protein